MEQTVGPFGPKSCKNERGPLKYTAAKKWLPTEKIKLQSMVLDKTLGKNSSDCLILLLKLSYLYQKAI